MGAEGCSVCRAQPLPLSRKFALDMIFRWCHVLIALAGSASCHGGHGQGAQHAKGSLPLQAGKVGPGMGPRCTVLGGVRTSDLCSNRTSRGRTHHFASVVCLAGILG